MMVKNNKTKRLEILLIEDNEDDAEQIEKSLDPERYHITNVWNGKKALDILIKQDIDIDVVLLEKSMPHKNGLGILKKIREKGKEYAFIFLTIDNSVETAVKAMKLGALDFLQKSSGFEGLPEMINKAHEIHQSKLEHKKSEEALKKSNEQFRFIAENTSDNIALTTFDLKSKYIYVSPSVKPVLGYNPEDLLGKSFFDFIHPEDKKVLYPLLKKYVNFKIKKLLSGKEIPNSETIEFRFLNKTGNWRFMQSTVNIAGKQLLAVTRDITERKKAEETLIQSEKSYRDLFNNATDAIYIQDREGHFLDINQGAVDMYGYPKEFFLGKTPEFLSAPGKNDMKKILGFVEDAFNGKPQQYDFWGIRKNGEVFPKIVRSQKGFYHSQEVIITFALDITEHNRVEKALNKKIIELEIFNDAAVDRELIINELRKEINELLMKQGKNPKYKIAE